MELIQGKETDRLSLISCLECHIHGRLVVYSCSIWSSGYLVIRVMFKVAANVSNACLCFHQFNRDATLEEKCKDCFKSLCSDILVMGKSTGSNTKKNSAFFGYIFMVYVATGG